MIWVVLALIVAAVLIYVCAPLLTAPKLEAGKDKSLQLYQAQIAEIDRQLSIEDIDKTELLEAKTALARKTLEQADNDGSRMSYLGKTVFMPIIAVFGLATVLLYSQLGTPTQIGKPSDNAQRLENLPLDQLVVRLEEQLNSNPANPNGWILYARSLMTLGRHDDALAAYDQALALTNSDAKVLTERASAVQYIGQIQQGAQTGNPGPSRADVEAAAAMTSEERAAMIENMVEGLSARLAEDPSDEDGWIRLLKARQVLGQPDKIKIEVDRMKAAFDDRPETIAKILSVSGLDTQ